MANIDSLALVSSSSIVSFEIQDLLDQRNGSVLCESLSIDTLSTSSSALSIPALPPRCRTPMHAIVDLNGKFTKVTVPTAPRMRAMIKDGLCVDQWRSDLRSSSAPDHCPWSEAEDTGETTWLPEGSIHTPEAFRQALSSARASPAYQSIFRKASASVSAAGDRASSPTSPTPISPTLLRRMSYHPSSFRNALVFEREISLKSEAGVKRWSMQVPASTMKPELVDIVVELQKLNSFFNDGVSELDQRAAALDKQRHHMSTPALTVSDSHDTVPLALGLARENTTTLIANRRGKKAPPPLNLTKQQSDDPYPGIPTAFLGTPSAYHPEVDTKPKGNGPTMNINDMISSLRSQCAAISRSPTSDIASSPLESVSEEPEERIPKVREESKHPGSGMGSQAMAFSVAIPPTSDLDDLMRRTLPAGLIDIPDHLSDSASEHLTESFSDFLREFESEALQPPANSITGSAPPPPSSPLPGLPDVPLPSLPHASLPDVPIVSPQDEGSDSLVSPSMPSSCRSPSPSLSPRLGGLRGILKGGKNVRFASLPTNRRETSPAAIEAYAVGRSVDDLELEDVVVDYISPTAEYFSPTEDYFSHAPRAQADPKSPTDFNRSSTESSRSSIDDARKQSPTGIRPVGRHSTGSAPARQPSPLPRRPSPLRSTFTAAGGVVPVVPALPSGVRASMISPAKSRISYAPAKASSKISPAPTRVPTPSGRTTPGSSGRVTPTVTKPSPARAPASKRGVSMMPPPRANAAQRPESTPVDSNRQRVPLARASVANGALASGPTNGRSISPARAVSPSPYTKVARPMTIGAPIKRPLVREDEGDTQKKSNLPLESPRRAPVTPSGGKENSVPGAGAAGSVRASRMPTPVSLGRKGGGTMRDENAARADAAGMAKSRMPVPLRNILTRFK